MAHNILGWKQEVAVCGRCLSQRRHTSQTEIMLFMPTEKQLWLQVWKLERARDDHSILSAVDVLASGRVEEHCRVVVTLGKQPAKWEVQSAPSEIQTVANTCIVLGSTVKKMWTLVGTVETFKVFCPQSNQRGFCIIRLACRKTFFQLNMLPLVRFNKSTILYFQNIFKESCGFKRYCKHWA